MLVQLAIRDIVLIDRLDLGFARGLTVLTGETGAGKSILLDAFALALGARGDGSLVRQGAAQGQVTAAFDLASDHPARAVAAAADIDVPGEMILRRVQMADGRTRAFINDAPVSGQILRAVARAIVEIHGQHDDRALVDPAAHRALIDAYGALEGEAAGVRAAHEAWRAAEAELKAERARVEKARADADYLRHAHEELAKLAPEEGEEERLAARRAAMMGSEKVVGELREAHEQVAGQGSPIAALSALMRRLQRRETQAPELITPPVKALDEALSALEAAESALSASLRAADFDPRELESAEERLFALRAAGRKYAVAIPSLPALAKKFADDLALLDAGEARLERLSVSLASARRALADKAAALSASRARAAAALDAAVNSELAPLKLERASFMSEISVDAADPGPDGIDRIEFWVRTNPGTRPGPLMKVASGGELARFMLALKVALAERGSAPTLVFDEIDTGVGGAVADAIGERLARLAGKAQVLAVTHAPQVAAKAGAHLRISKADAGDSVATRVAALGDKERREEIARMLSGAKVTDEARAAAGRLLKGAK